MRERMAKEKTLPAVTRPSFQQEAVRANIIAEPNTESQLPYPSSGVVSPAEGMVTVSRENLYTLVWTKPMTTVAARFGISANYLSRVCDHLNVPHPNRGYWAKVSVGSAPRRPALPVARPGEVLEWTKGQGVP